MLTSELTWSSDDGSNCGSTNRGSWIPSWQIIRLSLTALCWWRGHFVSFKSLLLYYFEQIDESAIFFSNSRKRWIPNFPLENPESLFLDWKESLLEIPIESLSPTCAAHPRGYDSSRYHPNGSLRMGEIMLIEASFFRVLGELRCSEEKIVCTLRGTLTRAASATLWAREVFP